LTYHNFTLQTVTTTLFSVLMLNFLKV